MTQEFSSPPPDAPDLADAQATANAVADSLVDEVHATHASSAEYQDAPAHLRAVAHLYGIETVPVEKARYLELGCAAAGGLLPYAGAYPSARAIGVDISPDQIALGRQACQDLKIKNLELHVLSLDDLLNSNLGTFDYIVVHGVYGLVDLEARSAILRYCLAHLGPLGIISFRYSTYPGAKIQEILRDGIQLQTSMATTEDEQLRGARSMLTFLSKGLSQQNTYVKAMRREVQAAEASSDYSLSFKYLQGLDTPCYLMDFATQALQADLSYVGDAEPHTELPQTYGEDTLAMCDALGSQDNKLITQQYLDFLTGREFRTSLLVSTTRADHILPAPDLNRLADLSFAGSFSRVITDAGAMGKGHTTGQGSIVGINDDRALQMLDSMGKVWPFPLEFKQLAQNISDPVRRLLPDAEDNETQTALDTLKALYPKAGHALRLAYGPHPYQQARNANLRTIDSASYALLQPGNSPSTSAGCRLSGVNLWHDTVRLKLNSYEREWLTLFDGKTPFAGIVRAAESIWNKVPATLIPADDTEQPDNEIPPSDTGSVFSRLFCIWIDHLRTQGMLAGSIDAWEPYFQYAVKTHAARPNQAFGYAASLLMHICPYQFGGLQVARPQAAPKAASVLPGELPLKTLKQQQAKLDALIQAGKYLEATEFAKYATRQWPDEYQTWANLTSILSQRGVSDEILYPALRALALRPRLTRTYGDLAMGLWRSHKRFALEWIVRQLLRINDQLSSCWGLLGEILENRNGKGQEAELCARRAAEITPNTIYLSNLAGICSKNMKSDDAERYYRQALKIDPKSTWILSNLLFTQAHQESVDPKLLFEEHLNYGRTVKSQLKSAPYETYDNEKKIDRPLRVGFVSADLHTHVVSYFIEEVWAELDLSKIQIYVYSNTTKEDHTTQKLKKYTRHWESIVGIDDSIAAERIHNAQIDILFDLSGHTGGNRLPMFALRPTPIQISWIGYPGTTGLEAMDYRVMYSKSNIDLQDQFTEKFLVLPYAIGFTDDSAPDVNSLPALKNGHFTFGSFNRPQKINGTTIRIWAEVLKAVSNSRILIANMDGMEMIEKLTAEFSALGIPAERIDFRERAKKTEYMKMHHEVDLILDTIPYGGGTTLNHGYWMGVPTLTIKGNSAPGRYGSTMSIQLGLEDFIANTVEEYIEKSSSWAIRTEDLANIRQELRNRMNQAEHNKEHKGIGHFLQKGLYLAWERWINGEALSHVIVDPE